MALFVNGLVLSHYNNFNLSKTSQITAEYIFASLASLSEFFVYLYMGMGVFTGRFKSWSPLFFVLAMAACVVARMLNIFPFSFLANFARRKKITGGMQVVMWFAGLRGAISFALSQSLPAGPAKDIYSSTTLMIVLFTTMVCGGLTEPLMNRMNVKVPQQKYASETIRHQYGDHASDARRGSSTNPRGHTGDMESSHSDTTGLLLARKHSREGSLNSVSPVQHRHHFDDDSLDYAEQSSDEVELLERRPDGTHGSGRGLYNHDSRRAQQMLNGAQNPSQLEFPHSATSNGSWKGSRASAFTSSLGNSALTIWEKVRQTMCRLWATSSDCILMLSAFKRKSQPAVFEKILSVRGPPLFVTSRLTDLFKRCLFAMICAPEMQLDIRYLRPLFGGSPTISTSSETGRSPQSSHWQSASQQQRTSGVQTEANRPGPQRAPPPPICAVRSRSPPQQQSSHTAAAVSRSADEQVRVNNARNPAGSFSRG